MTYNTKVNDTTVKSGYQDTTTYLSFDRVNDDDVHVIIQSFKGKKLIGYEFQLIEISELKKLVDSI